MNWNKLDSRHVLGESLFWHPREDNLYGIDIGANDIWRWLPSSQQTERWRMPSTPGCIAPAQNGLVIALRDGIYTAEIFGGRLDLLTQLGYDPMIIRANDGKCDRWGRLWVATVDETKTQKKGALYCVDARHTHKGRPVDITVFKEGILTGNGLAIDPQGRYLYFADTPTHQVLRWLLHEDIATMQSQSPQDFASLPVKPHDWQWTDRDYVGRPDGAICDADGNYWVACYEGGCIQSYAEDGTLRFQLATPALCPTIVCFGGKDFKTLFIASSIQGRSPQELENFPQSGYVFMSTVPAKGFAPFCFIT